MTKNIYKGRVVTLDIDTVTLPNGVTVDLETIRHPGASAVVPIKDDGTVVLIRQFRHAAGGFIYEIPAGKLNPGEDPLSCAAVNVTNILKAERECVHGARIRKFLEGRLSAGNGIQRKQAKPMI